MYGMTWRSAAFGVGLGCLGGIAMMNARCAAAELVPLGTEHRVWTMGEFTVSGVPASQNPYDADELAVDAVFKGPDGSEIRLPAFWYQGFRRELAQRDAKNKQGKLIKRETEVLTSQGEAGGRSVHSCLAGDAPVARRDPSGSRGGVRDEGSRGA